MNRKIYKLIITRIVFIGIVCMGIFYYGGKVRNKLMNLYQQFQAETQTDEWIDLAYWQGRNPDVYAWIRIPGTKIDYPILQSEEDGYYLSHDIEKESNIYGAIYTESVNEKDFSSPNTVVYGHHMKDKSMFGSLDEYLDRDYFEKHPTVVIFTPGEKRTYHIVAAYEHPAEHLLTTYDFSTTEGTNAYLQQIPDFVAASGGVMQEGVEITSPLLTLSTCTRNDRQKRCLVQAILEKCEKKKE